DHLPPLVLAIGELARFGQIADPIERNLDVGRWETVVASLRRAERPSRRAGQRIAVAQGVQDLTANAPRRVRAKGGAAIASVALRRSNAISSCLPRTYTTSVGAHWSRATLGITRSSAP